METVYSEFYCVVFLCKLMFFVERLLWMAPNQAVFLHDQKVKHKNLNTWERKELLGRNNFSSFLKSLKLTDSAPLNKTHKFVYTSIWDCCYFLSYLWQCLFRNMRLPFLFFIYFTFLRFHLYQKKVVKNLQIIKMSQPAYYFCLPWASNLLEKQFFLAMFF